MNESGAGRFVMIRLMSVAASSPSIGEADVRHVAKLGRLALSDEQVTHFAGQLGQIMAHIAKLSELDVQGVQPMAHPLDMVNVLRDDVEQPGSAVDAMLMNAPEQEQGFFKVPKVIGDGGGA